MAIQFGNSSNMNNAGSAAAPGSINLTKMKKGQVINLTKSHPGLKNVQLGLGWDANTFSNKIDADLDAVAFLCGDANKCIGNDGFIFYYNLCYPYQSPQQLGVADVYTGYEDAVKRAYEKGGLSVYHAGDNKTGSGEGDDETIFVNLDELPANIQKVAFAVTINQPTDDQGQPIRDSRGNVITVNFGSVENAYIRLVDADTGRELERYELTDDFSCETAVLFAEMYRNRDGAWLFKAVGNGFEDGLDAMCARYGLNAAYC